jgi:hypothetical protein
MEKQVKQRPKVFIINNSGHDFSQAEDFGELVFLTSGAVDSSKSNLHYRELAAKMSEAKEGDYILVTSLASINAIAGWIMGRLGLNLRLLIYSNNKYVVKTIYNNLLEEDNGQTN